MIGYVVSLSIRSKDSNGILLAQHACPKQQTPPERSKLLHSARTRWRSLGRLCFPM
jgi:hypothetical protein